MKIQQSSLKGWNIVTYSGFIISSLLALIAIKYGITEPGMRLAIRLTARTSVLLFLSAFVASTLRKLWLNPFTTWLLKNRRYLGVSMAVSHGFHALAILGLAAVTSGETLEYDHGGMLGYLFIIAMTFTSFNSTANWLGQRSWKILHRVGMYYLWLAFTYTFSQRLSQSILIYFPFVSLLILALILRLIVPRIPQKIFTQEAGGNPHQ